MGRAAAFSLGCLEDQDADVSWRPDGFHRAPLPAPLQPGIQLCPLNSSPQPLQPGGPEAQAQTCQPHFPGLLLAAWAAGSSSRRGRPGLRGKSLAHPWAGQAQMTTVSLPDGRSQAVRGREPVQGLGALGARKRGPGLAWGGVLCKVSSQIGLQEEDEQRGRQGVGHPEIFQAEAHPVWSQGGWGGQGLQGTGSGGQIAQRHSRLPPWTRQSESGSSRGPCPLGKGA